MTEDLHSIRLNYPPEEAPIDLMLAHLGGTMIPSPTLSPLAFMVSMDGAQGVRLMKLIEPEVTIPIHVDDYEVFGSGIGEFWGEVEREKRGRLDEKIVVLGRRECFRFRVRGEVGRMRGEKVYFGGGSSP
jgi:L-ascorbate metabolism protein UlaG (beta-lactamase superfamily)